MISYFNSQLDGKSQNHLKMILQNPYFQRFCTPSRKPANNTFHLVSKYWQSSEQPSF